jgi:hypothetical protein
LDDNIPKKVVLGKTADISPFCKLGFWDWVKFQDLGVFFPDDTLVLGYGSCDDTHVMRANGEVEDHSMV